LTHAAAIPIEAILKRDKVVLAGSLILIAALAWIYIAFVANADMAGMPTDMVMPFRPWTELDFALMFVMWSVMMVGMMLPSAAPAILLFAAFTRRQREQGHVMAPAGAFVAGYLIAWTIFSLGATLLQWGLEALALVSPMMIATSPVLGGGLLIAAGLYQWTPVKHVCLAHCRAPLDFVARRFRPGVGGALRMGMEHGAFCVGCCWALMGLLFFAGVMNLVWVALIAIFVLLEKIAPFGAQSGRLSGLLLIATGLFILLRS
jgi:predicted metal-binding membrane protein